MKVFKILVVDDDLQLVAVTKKIIENFDFFDYSFSVLEASSEEKAKQIISDNQDIAVFFFDVVMENKDSGLRLVSFVRDEKKLSLPRIILRTGNIDEFPPIEVSQKYDINEYIPKSFANSEKIKLSLMMAIKVYSDLVIIENKYKEIRGYEKDVKESNLKLTRFIETAFKLSDANPPALFLNEATEGLNLTFNPSKNTDFKEKSFFLKTEIDFDRVKREKLELKNTEGYRSSQVAAIIEIIRGTSEKEKIKKSLSSLKDLLSEKELKDLLNHLDFEKKRLCEEILPFALKNSFKREINYIVGDFVSCESIEDKKKIAEALIKLCKREGATLEEAGIPASLVQELQKF